MGDWAEYESTLPRITIRFQSIRVIGILAQPSIIFHIKQMSQTLIIENLDMIAPSVSGTLEFGEIGMEEYRACDFAIRDSTCAHAILAQRESRNTFAASPTTHIAAPMTSDAQAPVKLSLPLVTMGRRARTTVTDDIIGISARHLQRATRRR